MKKRFPVFLLIVLIVLNMYMIYSNSAKTASESNEVSKAMAGTIADSLESTDRYKENNITVNRIMLNNKLREFAHSAEFLSLGFLVCFLFYILIKTPFGKYISIIITFVFCTLYAVTDEFHQTFVDGRGAQFSDVVLDSLGAFIGILAFCVVCSVIPKSFSEAKK